MKPQIIIRTTFTERLAFLGPPPKAVRQALKAAGFTYNGALWIKARGTTSTLTPSQLDDLIATSVPDEPDIAETA